ncbi:dynein axonemal intermediate chain 7 homolog isoform X2 [Diabrotica virgifera virgifera]|uniref:Protein CASC1-like n=1 Tax=Diabrotica virgifera virgifera TaxID=50390 RepID=A0ABM5KQL9_DIAVI|nr:dynein axonemal intermediate chain 7 homolog isoform X2 [Diabrotica virgifera virgifera]
MGEKKKDKSQVTDGSENELGKTSASKEKKKKGKKKGKAQKGPPARMAHLLSKAEFESSITVVRDRSLKSRSDSKALGMFASKSADLGAVGSKAVAIGIPSARSIEIKAPSSRIAAKTVSSRMVKSKSSVHRSRSKRLHPSSSYRLLQDDDESYSTASSESEEEKSVVKTRSRKRKQRVVKVTAPEGEDILESEQDTTVDKAPKTKKGKRGKKGKPKEPKEEKIVSKKVSEDEGEDILAQILKLKSGETVAPVPESIAETEETDKSKLKKKSAKKKKDKKMTPQMAEQLRMEAEQEAIRQAELEKVRLAEERLIAIEKEKKETAEMLLRDEQLSKTQFHIKKATDTFVEATRIERDTEDWKLFVECGKLPNPYFCNQMNTYLHIWEEDIDATNMQEASTRTEDTLKLISDLEELIASYSESGENREKLENWLWIRKLFRDSQQTSLDVATYRLLRNVFKNLVRIDIPTAEYNFKDSFVTLCVWLRVQLPKPLPNPRRPPKPRVDVTFKELDNLQVILPLSQDLEKKALRAMYVKYDHLSDTCENFYSPPVPHFYDLDLRETCKKEWRAKLKYNYDHRDKKPVPVFEPDDPQAAMFIPEPEDFDSDEEIPSVPYKKLDPSPKDYVLIVEEQNYANARENFKLNIPANVVNLRRSTLLGGVYHLNLLHQPPQPQDYVILDLNITRLFVPKQLEHVEFYVNYMPPQPTDPDVRKPPEEIEEDMKKNEEALDSLIFITLTWPKHVIFLELPFVCVWDDKENWWSTRCVHDLKHNEEKGTLSFRSQVFGIFGLATVRYANLPYQAWEVKPEANGSVNITITSAILILEFNVQDGKICLVWVQNSPNNALKPYIGKYMKLYAIKKILKETGVDIFPEHDAFCYVEGSCEKHWPMEKNLYCNIAALSGCFNFAWSRWNLSLGRRTIVCLMREFLFDKSKQYCADLFTLMKAISGIAVRKRVGEFSKLNVHTVSEFLIATRVLSFS